MAAQPKTIVLGVTGSIAAYKACELVRMWVKRGYDVNVVMTRSAQRFVGELTFRTLSRNPVQCEMFEEPAQWRPGHIGAAEKADLLVIAPATANILAKMAHGIADDLLSAVALATRAPILAAPAMNTGMWENPATQANLALLESRGVRFVSPGSGELACGTSGTGRMAEPAQIFEACEKILAEPRPNA